MYSLEIGPWVDIAFLTICASTLDLLHTRARLSPWEFVCHWCWCDWWAWCDSHPVTLDHDDQDDSDQEHEPHTETTLQINGI